MQKHPSLIVSENSEKNIRIFENSEFGKVRTVLINGEPYFVGKDIADILGYSNSKDALIKHVDDEDKRILKGNDLRPLKSDNFMSEKIPNRGLSIINESGLYSLILSSKLPSAKKFKHWVTSEVLPSIRKTGSYVPKTLQEALRAYADELDRAERLQIENNQLEHALEYDKIVGWKRWIDIKNEWKETFIELQHRISFNFLIKKAELIEGEDYCEKVMGMDCFPTKMISSSGEEKIWDYLDR